MISAATVQIFKLGFEPLLGTRDPYVEYLLDKLFTDRQFANHWRGVLNVALLVYERIRWEMRIIINQSKG
jgi:hypothetical protein